MTETVIEKHSDEALWPRVRAALAGLRPAAGLRETAYEQPALPRAMGMRPKLGERIDEELAKGWSAAAARKVSLSLLVIEIDGLSDYFSAYGKEAADDCVTSVMGAITGMLPRADDCCLRWGATSLVIVLPDLPVLLARASAAKMHDAVRRLGLVNKESHAGLVTVSMGLAVGNPRGGYDKKFFATALEALKKAQRRGLGRLETIDLRPAQERKRKKAA